jgi:uncharacterized membrane protein YccC
MKTTLQVYCEARAVQFKSISQAQQEFSRLTLEEKDHVCGALVAQIRDISDPRSVLFFTKARLYG